MSQKTVNALSSMERLLSTAPVSQLLQELIVISQGIGESEIARWAKLEANGYLSDNLAMQEEDSVPKYRTVIGQYYDRLGTPLVIKNPKLNFVLEYGLRHSTAELESFAKMEANSLMLQDPARFLFLNEHFGSEIESFRFTPYSVLSVLAAIRTQIIEKLGSLRNLLDDDEAQEFNALTISGFHPRVVDLAGELFEDGHYRSALLDTFIALVEQVKAKSGRYDLDGTKLMQQVFAPASPTILISDDFDEQMGFMWLFSGAVMALRNAKAHKVIPENDRQKTLEWLGYASALFKALDGASVTTNPKPNK